MEPFADRTEAGRRLAVMLKALPLQDPVVLALPRGGVPVAVEVARALGAPMDLLIVRKVGALFQPELALGALAEARCEGPAGSVHEPGSDCARTPKPRTLLQESRQLGTGQESIPQNSLPQNRIRADSMEEEAGAAAVLYVDEDACRQHSLEPLVVEREAKAHRQELQRRVGLYRGGKPPLSLKGRVVVVVDDGAATGATLRAALKALAPCEVRSIVVALPVAPAQTVAELAGRCERIVCLAQPEPFVAVGLYYRRFPQLSDEDVMAMMRAVAPPPSTGRHY